MDLATSLDDLKVPPGNRLHSLKGDRKGQHAIAINDQWRICFRFVDGGPESNPDPATWRTELNRPLIR